MTSDTKEISLDEDNVTLPLHQKLKVTFSRRPANWSNDRRASNEWDLVGRFHGHPCDIAVVTKRVCKDAPLSVFWEFREADLVDQPGHTVTYLLFGIKRRYRRTRAAMKAPLRLMLDECFGEDFPLLLENLEPPRYNLITQLFT